MGPRKHRAIVEPIAHHGHAVAARLERLQAGQLVGRRAVPSPRCNLGTLGHAGHRGSAISRKHLHRDASALEGAQGGWQLTAQRFFKFKSRDRVPLWTGLVGPGHTDLSTVAVLRRQTGMRRRTQQHRARRSGAVQLAHARSQTAPWRFPQVGDFPGPRIQRCLRSPR